MSSFRTETSVTFLIVLTLVAVSVGGMVEIFPQFFNSDRTQPIEGLQPLAALEFEGRDIYIREGCHVCHTQMVRPLRAETERYGHYSVAGEDVYEHPFMWGSKRTGPDLARVGGRYSDDWHRAHLNNPRSVVPQSNMPSYPWLFDAKLSGDSIATKLGAMRTLGVPYTDADIAGAHDAVAGRTESEALIAYLQHLGVAMQHYGGDAR
jgi:cytochrome c oxidase cbb3-type subunit II